MTPARSISLRRQATAGRRPGSRARRCDRTGRLWWPGMARIDRRGRGLDVLAEHAIGGVLEGRRDRVARGVDELLGLGRGADAIDVLRERPAPDGHVERAPHERSDRGDRDQAAHQSNQDRPMIPCARAGSQVSCGPRALRRRSVAHADADRVRRPQVAEPFGAPSDAATLVASWIVRASTERMRPSSIVSSPAMVLPAGVVT